MSFRYRYRKQITIVVSIILLIISGSTVLFLNLDKEEKTKPKEKIVSIKKAEKKSPKVETKEEYMVDIKGEINTPGTYLIESGKRVIDVINKAGGLTENADTSIINLSKKVTDEMVIIIYSYYEVNNFEKVKEVEEQVINVCVNSNEVKNDACIENKTSDKETASLININTATIEQLQSLTGIGEAKAKDIVSYRETNGLFTKIEDLMNVTGIGEAVFAKIKDFITI